MRDKRELREDKLQLKGAYSAILDASADNEGKGSISVEGIADYLRIGVEALDELEKIRMVLGPTKMERVDATIENLESMETSSDE